MIDGTNATNETENYGYPQFVAEDKPGWLTDWNKTMEAIDANEAGIQTQVTENKEDLDALEMTVSRHEEELNGPQGAFQRISDNQNRIQDLEEKVGDDEHGLVKDMIDVKRDLTETNTMAVKTNGAVNSIRDLICNPFVSTSQYNAGAYVYLQDADDGEIHYYKCNTTHRGAFNPDHFDDVTEKLITALDNSGGGSGSQYVLPVAGSADDVDPLLGGVIIGDGLVIDPETGVLSTEGGGGGGGDVPYASKLQAGIMKPGNGLSDGHDNGTIDVMVDNDTIVINQETGRLEAHKQFTPQDLPVATDNTVGVVKGKSSLNNNEGKVNIANDGAMSVAIDNDYIKRKSDGSLTVNPDKIGSASGINVGEGLEKPDSNTIALKRGTPSQLGGWKPDARDFYKENDKDMVQLKPNGGLEHTSEGLAVVGGGGGGGTTYSAGDGINIDSNDEISAKLNSAANNALSLDSNGLMVGVDNQTTIKRGNTMKVLRKNETGVSGVDFNNYGFYTVVDGVAPTVQPGGGVSLNDIQTLISTLDLDYPILPSKTSFKVSNNSQYYTKSYGFESFAVDFEVTDGTGTWTGPILAGLNGLKGLRLSGNGDFRLDAPYTNQTLNSKYCEVGDCFYIVTEVTGGTTDAFKTRVRTNHQASHGMLIRKVVCTSRFDLSTLFKVGANEEGNVLVSVADVDFSPYFEFASLSDTNTKNSKNIAFNRHPETPFIDILINGISDYSDITNVGGVYDDAKGRLTIPDRLRNRRCMAFFPFSLYVEPNVNNNPFDNKSFTGKHATITYTLAYSNVPGEATSVGTFVPFYTRDLIVGSDVLSNNQGGSIMTTSNGAPIGDWKILTFDPTSGTTDSSDAGNVKNRYECVEMIPSDATEILLLVTIRVTDSGSGTIQQYTSRHGVSGADIFSPNGSLVLLPID